MAFPDPIEDVNFGPGVEDLNRVSTGKFSSEYANETGTSRLKVDHTYSRRNRSVIRIDLNKVTPDPFIPSQNTQVSTSIYLVADRPPAGYTNTELQEIYTGLSTLLSRDSGKIVKAWLSGQS